MEELLLFLLTFLFVLCLYEIIIVRRARKKNKKKKKKVVDDTKKKNKEPLEVTYLVKKYKLDLDRISYNRLLQVIAFTSSFDIALIVSIIMLIENYILKMIVGFVLIILIIIVSYHIVYLFYKKKGKIKDES